MGNLTIDSKLFDELKEAIEKASYKINYPTLRPMFFTKKELKTLILEGNDSGYIEEYITYYTKLGKAVEKAAK